ncbi:unnamed protein product [Vitrella brassicaformis CCMP3155]|uniref:Bystin n=1 Tax=Vitrella brassicaformis (strain CCMP3155) TaxID=1169540 RepID=A0A0G4G2E8_VITBC|nr:unnamed protein product [Vitrella brassicaformis CCMP3155]|eukprot:CEM22182.1 unnamed protein product [Vitrella brassicaformis CCMP3155]
MKKLMILMDESTRHLRVQPRDKASKRHQRQAPEQEEDVPVKLSDKLLKIAREQKDDEDEQDGEDEWVDEDDDEADMADAGDQEEDAPAAAAAASAGVDRESLSKGKRARVRRLEQTLQKLKQKEREKQQPRIKGASEVRFDDTASVARDADGYVMGDAVTEEEERAMQVFLPAPGRDDTDTEPRTLAELILQKIREKEIERFGHAVDDPAANKDRPAPPEGTMMNAAALMETPSGIPPKAVEVYTAIGKWMSQYKSGKLPKAFKVIPRLKAWEEFIYLTDPVNWSPSAMFAATKIFASNMTPAMAQRFYNLVLLPAVREDIQANRRLNFHYYEALKKAVFKPAAWFKGILLPLAQDNCTLREAVIVGSILAKVTMPVIHSAAALTLLCRMRPWYGTTSYFITVLLNKKYALPYKALDEVVDHFHSFVGDTRTLPVLWHRSLLVFAQRYKLLALCATGELEDHHREKLKQVMRAHTHYQITPEVRRELSSAVQGENDMDIE